MTRAARKNRKHRNFAIGATANARALQLSPVSPACGFTLVELLVVCLIVVLLTTFLVRAVIGAQDASTLTQCANRLHQVYQGFLGYKNEYRKFPSALPPDGFSDACNWKDIWEHSDYDGQYFSGITIGPMVITPKTKTPRLPRLLAEYAGAVEVLHCTDQGTSAYWPDVGPYFYNTTNPYDVSYAWGGLAPGWYPMVEREKKRGAEGWQFESLAACQNPVLAKSANSWRHGKKGIDNPGGLNNHLFATGNVKTFTAPKIWKLSE
ncbi:MAG: prepilin-type N-terminal cleavage/methylation domain-containing protein [Planctomycetes bacterium]|nr:prepilin-type N-terminal cleavage/methylation domain-containing protein [Planctomycetota bacterium]